MVEGCGIASFHSFSLCLCKLQESPDFAPSQYRGTLHLLRRKLHSLKGFVMLSTRKPPTSQPHWHSLYQAALFETDRSKMPHRIDEAEKAILARVKELFIHTGDHIEEDLVLDDALYGLRALRNCVMHEASAA